MTASDGLLRHIGLSLFRSCLGLLTASALAVPLGLVLAFAPRRLRVIADSLTNFLSQISPFVLFHVVILFLGIGERAKISVIAWACLWPIVINTVSGVVNVNRVLVKAGRAFGISAMRLFATVILPAAFPAIFAGIRISAGYSLFMLVAAEMMGGSSGLGWLILNNQVNFQIENIFAIALCIALLGTALDAFMQLLQKRLFPSRIEAYMNSSEN